MRYATIMSAILLIAGVAGCNVLDDGFIDMSDSVKGSGNVAKEVRSFGTLSGVHLATIGELRVERGDKDEITIEMDDNLLEYVETEEKNGILVIGIRHGISIRTRSKVRYTLTVTSLERISASSSGDIIARDMIGDRLDVSLSSSGDATISSMDGERISIATSSSGDIRIVSLTGGDLQAQLSSSGDITIKEGQVDRQNISISSSGDYDALHLQSREAIVSTSSSGDARVWVTETLKASTSSSGSIHYRGDPRVTAHESSSGDVIHIR